MLATLGIVLVEETNGEAILRTVTELQPSGTVRMSVPYRYYCAYTFANGKLHAQSWIPKPRGTHVWRQKNV